MKILLLAPIAIWFSNWPQISLGSDGATNFRVTLTMIYLALLALVAFVKLIKNYRNFSRRTPFFVANWVCLVFVVYDWLTIIWSDNRSRTLLTASIVSCLYVVFLALTLTKNLQRYVQPLAKIYIVTAMIMSVLALMQFIYGAFWARGFLLCAGCVAGQFGFVRPNVFAIEPQFLGSLLLAPILLIFHEIITQKHSYWRDLVFGCLLLTLLLTLSRGAIFAFLIGVIVVVIFSWRRGILSARDYCKKVAIGVLICAVSLAVCLVMQGVTAAVNPNTKSGFTAAVNASLNQLSLGLIKIQDIKVHKISSVARSTVSAKEPAFSGYVAESTNVRTSLSKIALKTWAHEKLSRKLLGVGLGGSGVAMAQFLRSNDPKQIVQNQFVETLLELGVVGAIILAAILLGLIYTLWRNQKARWTLGIVVAFLVQWLFFSGYPSALHIYLVLMILYIVAKAPIGRHAALAPTK